MGDRFTAARKRELQLQQHTSNRTRTKVLRLYLKKQATYDTVIVDQKCLAPAVRGKLLQQVKGYATIQRWSVPRRMKSEGSRRATGRVRAAGNHNVQWRKLYAAFVQRVESLNDRCRR